MSIFASIVHAIAALAITLSSIFVASTTDRTSAPPPVVGQIVASTTHALHAEATSTNQSAAAPVKGSGVNAKALPLGDKKYTTTSPQKGYIYICNVMTGGGGAQVNGNWIHGTTWDGTSKVAVQGSVSWPNASITISTTSTERVIKSNDLPKTHTTGIFPVQASDPAAQIDRNPSSITAQSFSITLPLSPVFASAPQCMYGQVGIMTTGVFIYNGFDAEYRDAAAHEVQDSCDGHPNEHGYHYHSLSACIKNATVSNVIGWAFDGFPITGPTLPDGTELATADLDECHGTTSDITVDGKTVNTYHYVMTRDFPYSVSCFKGKSYEPKPGGGSGQSGTQSGGGMSQGAPNGGPPQAAIDACASKSDSASCSFTAPIGTITGVCHTPPNTSTLACVPNH